MEKSLIVEIDADGVLYDLWGTFFNDCNFRYMQDSKNLGFLYTSIKTYNMSALTIEQRKLVNAAFNDADFMANLALYTCVPEALKTLYNLCKQGIVRKVIVNTLVFSTDVGTLRKQSLKRLFKQFEDFVDIHIWVDKKQYNIADVRIEDNPYCFDEIQKTQFQSRAKYNMLINQTYNQNVVINTPIIRCNNLLDAVQQITFLDF